MSTQDKAGPRTAQTFTRGLRPLRLSASLRRWLDELAVVGYPHEVCGLLIGRETDQGLLVERVTQTRNLATNRLTDRYLLDPEGFLAADEAARRDGLEIVGVWHTHPGHPARPSRTDLEAAWEGYSYVILSVERGRVADAKAWRLEGIEFIEQPIEELDS